MTEISNLPPLSNKLSKSNSPRQENSDEEINIDTLKKQFVTLYPRIQKIEKGVESIRSQMHLNLNKTIYQLSNEIEQLRTNKPGSKQRSLQTVLLEELDQSITNTREEVDTRFQKLRLLQENDLCMPPIFKPPIENANLMKRINSIEELYNNSQRKTTQRLLQIDKNISRLFTNSSVVDKSQVLQNEIALNQQNLNTLIEKADIMMLKMNSFNSKQAIVDPEQSDSTTTTQIDQDSLIPPNTIPDLSVPLNNLTTDFEAFQSQYQQEVHKIHIAQQDIQIRLDDSKQKVADLVNKSSQFSAHLEQSKVLCQSLIDKVESIASKTDDSLIKERVQQLVEEIRMEHESMEKEINQLAARIEKCM